MKVGNTIRNNRLRGLSKEDKEIEKIIIKKEKTEQSKEKAKEKTKEKTNKKLQEKENTDKKVGISIINTIPINNCEFSYIDDIVNKKDLEGKHIFIDPVRKKCINLLHLYYLYIFTHLLRGHYLL